MCVMMMMMMLVMGMGVWWTWVIGYVRRTYVGKKRKEGGVMWGVFYKHSSRKVSSDIKRSRMWLLF